MTQPGRSLLGLPIGACLLMSSAMAQEPPLDTAQKEAIAESILAREEARSGREFDPAFRAKARQTLAALPLAALESQESGLGLDSLGDSQADLVYTPVTPCRIIDTRLAGGTIGSGTTRSFLVTGADLTSQGGSASGCGVPFGPSTAAVINLVAVNPAGPGNLRITPFGTAIPLASIINYAAGLTIANGPAVAMCDPSATTCGNDITIQANASATHLVADVQGYFRRVATGGVGTALLADSAVTAPKIDSGVVVRSLNAQTDSVTLAGTNGLSVSQGSGTVTVASNATATNTAAAIVSRDGSGSFSAGSVGLAGNLGLPNTSSASVGVLTKDGTPFLHNFGSGNTFVGSQAGNMSMTGAGNTGVGFGALSANTTGTNNLAVGTSVLISNTAGSYNTGVGGGVLFSNTTGSGNSALGQYTLQANTAGGGNTAVGNLALYSNTTGNYNSAVGYQALYANTTASGSSAFGYQALDSNATGDDNSAVGYQALTANTTGFSNTAVGRWALRANTTGGSNSAVGQSALAVNTTGSSNSAFGDLALYRNTAGFSNSAVGDHALYSNTTGAANSAVGTGALGSNTTAESNSAYGVSALGAHTTGNGSSAFGAQALLQHSSGSYNTAVGAGAGGNLVTGSYNLYLDNLGGASTESNTIRIGNDGYHIATYVAGIYGKTSASGIAVYVNSSGQLGTTTSSRRYKEQIADMDAESDVLMNLRPVSFYYRPELDETHTRQYGLVAEEVAELAPELVVHDGMGAPQAVRYHFVNAMLLNEVQKQRRLVEEQKTTIGSQESRIQDLEARLARLEAALAADR
jgi:trimeric autotransporter adhesin